MISVTSVVNKATYPRRNYNLLKVREGLNLLIKWLNSQVVKQITLYFHLALQRVSQYKTMIDVEDYPFVMEIDIGAVVLLINETTYKSSPFLSKLPLQLLKIQLRMYVHW